MIGNSLVGAFIEPDLFASVFKSFEKPIGRGYAVVKEHVKVCRASQLSDNFEIGHIAIVVERAAVIRTEEELGQASSGKPVPLMRAAFDVGQSVLL